MSRQTVNCSANTFISRESPSTDHSSAAKLITSVAGSDDIGNSSYQNALLQFAIPDILLYKKITKVTLYYYIGSDTTAGLGLSTVVYFTPYITTNSAGSVTFNNVAAMGTLGERKMADKRGSIIGNWFNEDVTDIYTNNVTNGVFSIFISAGAPTSNEAYPNLYVGGRGGGYAAYLDVTYEDIAQIPPTISYPDGVYVREGEKVLFSWVYNSATAATQAGATLEWRSGTGTWNVITLTQEAQSYLCDVMFPQGTIEWRIKVTNNIGETSDYAYAKFEVIGKPAIPVITKIENKALPAIEWNASDQCAYEITISSGEVDILHETVYSGKMQYKPNLFLENGSYTVRLRTKNSIELWSDETSKTFAINAVLPEMPEIILRQDGRDIQLDITHDGTKVAIIRNDKVIAVLDEDESHYTDSTVVSGKEYTYKARAFKEGYSDSAAKSGMVDFEGFELRAGTEVLYCDKSENQFLSYTEERSTNRELIQYVGREYPVLEAGEFKSQKIHRNIYLSVDDYEIMKKINDGAAWYRDDKGNSFLCIVSDLSIKRYMNRGYIADIEVTRIHEDEVMLNE